MLWRFGGGPQVGGQATTPGSTLDLSDLQSFVWLAGLLALSRAIWVVAQRLLRRTPRVVASYPRADATGHSLAWFDEGVLAEPLRMLGGQRRGAGRQVDLPATVVRTVARAGWPELVRGGRLRTAPSGDGATGERGRPDRAGGRQPARPAPPR